MAEQRAKAVRAKIAAADAEAMAKMTRQERQIYEAGLSASVPGPSSSRVRALGQKYKHEEFE